MFRDSWAAPAAAVEVRDARVASEGMMAATARTSVWPLAVLALTMVVGTAAQYVFSPLQESAKADLGLSDLQLGLLQGAAVGIPVALLSLPIGWLCDRTHRVRLLLGLTLVWITGCVLTALAESFAMLVVGRSLAGVGVLCGVPVSVSLASDLSALSHRGRAMMLLAIGRICGPAVAFAWGGALLGVFAYSSPSDLAPWRLVQLSFAASGALLALTLLNLSEPARTERSADIPPAFAVAVRGVWMRRSILAPLILGQLAVIIADTAAAVWAAPVLARDYQQLPTQFGGWMGAIFLLAGFAGSAIGGLLADVAQRKAYFRGGMFTVAALAAAATIPGALFAVMPTVSGFAALMALFLIGGNALGVIMTTAVTTLLPNELRGTCLSIFFVLAAVLGIALTPSLVTVVSELLGGESHLRYAVSSVSLVGSILALLGYWTAARRAAVQSRSRTS